MRFRVHDVFGPGSAAETEVGSVVAGGQGPAEADAGRRLTGMRLLWGMIKMF